MNRLADILSCKARIDRSRSRVFITGGLSGDAIGEFDMAVLYDNKIDRSKIPLWLSCGLDAAEDEIQKRERRRVN